MVDQPTVIFGKTQSGKTWRAFHLWHRHQGPAIFADIQWRSYLAGTHYARSIEDVVAILHGTPDDGFAAGPKICWRLDNYGEFGDLADYLLGVHRSQHDYGRDLPTVAVFIDEAWRIAGKGADAENAAVRIFTEGFQHRIIGVALSQWVSQVAHLIPGNAYEFYVFNLWDRDLELLRTLYRMEIPDASWLNNYQYWRYDGDWWKGNAEGVEVQHEPAVPVVSDEGRSDTHEEPVSKAAKDETRMGEERPGVPQLRGFDTAKRRETDDSAGAIGASSTQSRTLKGFKNE